MVEQPVVRFQDVSKRFVYTVDKQKTVLETMISAFSRQARTQQEKDLWALQNVSFDVMPGQCVGIIGRNGSGKSTILKLIARILRPASGEVIVRGRVSALLELGTGFHPDLTGRENIFLNASLLGLSQQETEGFYDSIVAFSELGEFIDMPVKHYSSGMYMRLGFSVAIHVKPDVLIVDEILAVGDQAFQAKCIERIYDMKRNGTTIIIVSHELNMMRQLCSHLIWIDHGRIRAMGEADTVAGQYEAVSFSQPGHTPQVAQNGSFARWGTYEVEITAVHFLNSTGQKQESFKTGDPMTVEMAYLAHQPVSEPEFGLAIFRQDNVHVSGPNNRLAGCPIEVVHGPGIVRYHIKQLPLLPARYEVTAAIHHSYLPITYDYHQKAYSFRVIPGGTREADGLVEIPASWEWQPLLKSPISEERLTHTNT